VSISSPFIARPVATTLLLIAVILAGAIGPAVLLNTRCSSGALANRKLWKIGITERERGQSILPQCRVLSHRSRF
jgi:hypothetical protein